MKALRFDRNEGKARRNASKHGVTSHEAASAFHDFGALVISDPDHSEQEDRFVLLGMSTSLRRLVVVHTYRDDPDALRIISARTATKTESRHYATGRHR